MPQLIAGEDRVSMCVDEARYQSATLQVDQLCPVERFLRPDARQLAVLDPHDGALWQKTPAVENAAIVEDNLAVIKIRHYAPISDTLGN